jgi:threonine aldolase
MDCHAGSDDGDAAPYGDDALLTSELAARFSSLFERECLVCPVTSGIAANALALLLLAGPLESAISRRGAHAATREAGPSNFLLKAEGDVAWTGWKIHG